MNKYRMISIATAVAVVSAGCSSDNEEPVTKLPEPIQITMTGAESRAVEASTDFGIELFKAVCAQHEGENMMLSPLSASMCLSMAANGASEGALNGILEAMGMSQGSLDALNSINAQILETLPKTDPTTTVNLANSVWLGNGYCADDKFSSAMMQKYGAEV
ncbi:MAG: hypothetical protein NC043_06010 [Muribaculaceae bacterium]|nr:hypothetical protein [Muribaculaceae bacterium]